jgi:hypothetical protein
MRGEGVDEEDAGDDDEREARHAAREFKDHCGARRGREGHADGHEGRADGVPRRGAVDRHEVDRHHDPAERQHDVGGGEKLPPAAFEPADGDGAERGDQQRDAEPAHLGLVDLGPGEGGPGGQPAHLGQFAGIDRVDEADGRDPRHQRRDRQERGQKRQDARLGMLPVGVERVGGEQQEAERRGARDMDDAEIPRLHRELRQEGQFDPRPVGDRHTVERQHVEGGVDGGECGDGQVGAPGEQAAVALDRFLVDAFGDDLFACAGRVRFLCS